MVMCNILFSIVLFLKDQNSFPQEFGIFLMVVEKVVESVENLFRLAPK